MIRAALLLWAAGLFAILLWTLLWPLDRPLPQGDAIICLGAGVDSAGRIDQASTKRAETCAELARAGAAPIVIFTGGPLRPGLPTSADGMAEIALRAGLGGALVWLETASDSALQNALESGGLVATGARRCGTHRGLYRRAAATRPTHIGRRHGRNRAARRFRRGLGLVGSRFLFDAAKRAL